MSDRTEENPRQFLEGMDGRERPTTRAGETGGAGVRARWAWAEPTVWTERMLTALEEGVKGGKWYCLMDKILKAGNLESAYAKTAANQGSPGIDRVTVEAFGARLEDELARLRRALRDGTYAPQAVKRTMIPKPGSKGMRPLGIPTVRDRVVQGALRHVLEPIFERDFAERSYGFRPGRGCKDALRRVDALLCHGKTWVVDADIQGCFDSIPRDRLMARLREKVSDSTALGLVERFLEQDVFDGLNRWKPGAGTPQGAVLSPLLANIYLDPLDHRMERGGWEMIRYADDFVALCASEAEARAALEEIRDWTREAGLTLHPEKTRIVDATQKGGFDFLGYHFERGMKWPRKKSLRKLKDAIHEKTKRCSGHSLPRVIASLNPILRGWFGYFKHSHKFTFAGVDGYVRGRLRGILRKRLKLRGRARGIDHQRWPNAFFAEQGLYSLATAHAAACQSARR